MNRSFGVRFFDLENRLLLFLNILCLISTVFLGEDSIVSRITHCIIVTFCFLCRLYLLKFDLMGRCIFCGYNSTLIELIIFN